MHPKLRQGRRALIGALLILGLLAIAVTIFLLDDIQEAFTDTYSIVGVFGHEAAVAPGTPVWLAGQPAGKVVRVDRLPPDSDPRRLLAATLRLPSEHRALIRRDSELDIATPRIVSDPIVNLMPGSPASPVLRPGDTLYAHSATSLDSVAARARLLLGSLDSLRVEGQALALRLRGREPHIRQMIHTLGHARTELDAFLATYRDGPLGQFMANASARQAISRVYAAVEEIMALARDRAERLRDPESIAAFERLGERAAELHNEIERLQSALEEPRGSLRRWEKDPALRDAIVAVRAQLDSLIAEARANPWRFIF